MNLISTEECLGHLSLTELVLNYAPKKPAALKKSQSFAVASRHPSGKHYFRDNNFSDKCFATTLLYIVCAPNSCKGAMDRSKTRVCRQDRMFY